MNWPELKRQIRLQPYLIDPYRKISYREARRIWKEQGRPDVLELLEGARKKAGMTPEAWQTLTGLKIKTTRVTHHSAAVRRWAIACAFVLLFSAFLAFTTPGRAFAAQVYKTVVTIAENIFIRKEQTPSPYYEEPKSNLDDGNSNEKLDSLESAYENIGHPLFYFPEELYFMQNIEIKKDQSGTTLITQYTKGEMDIYLLQSWPQEGQKDKVTIQLLDEEYYSIYTSSGLVFEGTYVEKEDAYYGGAIGDDFLARVILEDITDLNEIETIINSIVFYPT